jgi:hypothetical protein
MEVPMNEKEKYYAEIETRLRKMNDTFHEIKTLQERKRESLPDLDLDIDRAMEKHRTAEKKLDELKKADEGSWQKVKTELEQLANDIDEDHRKAMAYAPH